MSSEEANRGRALTQEEFRALRRAQQLSEAQKQASSPKKLSSSLRPTLAGPSSLGVPRNNTIPSSPSAASSSVLLFGSPSSPSRRTLMDEEDHSLSPALRRSPVRGFNASRLSAEAMAALSTPSETQGIEPKVQVPFETVPGQIPRRIEIERRRRIYEAHAERLDDLLREQGVDYAQPEVSYLPLDAFDDTEFDARQASEWVAQGPTPAKALDGSSWKDCTVLAYDEKENRFNVKFADSDASASPSSLPRIHIVFKAEDPSVAAKRIATAHKARRDAESLLRYNLYVDSMPAEEAAHLGREQVDRIRSLSLNTPRLKENERFLDVNSLVGQVSIDYARTMNKVIFDTNLKNPSSDNSELFAALQLPAEAPAAPTPTYGMIQIPPHDFLGEARSFSFHTYLGQPEVIEALNKVRDECNRVLRYRVYNATIGSPGGAPARSMRLEEFEQMQSLALNHATSFLKDSWLSSLKTAVKTSLRDVGKGWLNIHEKSKEVYEMSKLKRFMTTVRFMMEDSLRLLVQQSCAEFVEFMERQCSHCANVTVNGTGAVSSGLNSEDIKVPLFLADLTERDGQFRFSTAIERFAQAPLTIFDKGLAALQDIPQLEPFVMDQFFWSQIPVLASINQSDPTISALRERLKATVEVALRPLREYVATYDSYKELAETNVPAYIKTYEEAAHSVDEMKTEINKHLNRKNVVVAEIPVNIIVGTFQVDCQQIRNALSRKCQDMGKQVMDVLSRMAREKSQFVRDSFNDINTKLQRRPKNIEQLTENREFMKTVPDTVSVIDKSIDEMRQLYDTLEVFQYQLPDDDFKNRWTAVGWPKKLDEQIESIEEALVKDKERFQEAMLSEQEVFSKELDKLSRTISGFNKHSDMNKVGEIAAEIKLLQKQLKECEEKSRTFNSREGLFGLGGTEYSQLSNINRDFEPYTQLWLSANDWVNWRQSWSNDPFDTLDPEQMDKDVSGAWRNMYKATKFFKDMPHILRIAEDIKSQIDEFKPIMPLITSLRNPGMRDRHWDGISNALGFEVRPGVSIHTLHDLSRLNLLSHVDKITTVCDVAGKEYNIERALDKMAKEWEPMNFEVLAYRESGTFIIKGSDEIQQLLDDHIVMTQSMTFSPFKKVFEERIAKWESQLSLVAEVLEEWLAVQRSWLYLEPIFSSEDIMRQLPNEAKRFTTVDRVWRKTMGACKQTPHAMTFCTTTSKLLEQLQESNKLLDLVQKGLNEYLETKRQAFARFYFLSNDELLEILSQTKEPRAVQPHLRKCFEAVSKLEFQPDLNMTAMYSGEGEMVPFVSGVMPKGNVEGWLGEVEQMMKKSIKAQVRDSVADYLVTPRTEWVIKWPGQIVLIGSQVYWTKEVAEALDNGGAKGIKDYYAVLEKQLLDLTEVVRGNISRLARVTLGALLTIEVHARDVIGSMVAEGISSTKDFEWISQMRYYWENDEALVRQVEAEFVYGYEYLGNTSRLVITPLTDRIYLTLTGALDLHLGGAPAGPAGTGKTETVKDLAKALAKQCVVFNCQEGLDFIAMGKFFKGLSMSGAWACFDEFNRIDVEVLSVVAQQISTMQQAIIQGMKRFVFEGAEISLDPSCAVFITMNPGYAGRTELPDNLKALFRPVACMVPDYALIGEIRMFSFGFRKAKPLSRKMVATFRLSSEQLSSQDHYDFGMRAVNTVISAAGLLKRENPDMDEDLLLLRALRDSNLPKFLVDDILLFNGIISDLFPGVKPPVIDYGELMDALKVAVAQKGLQPVDMFLAKCIQLYETTVLRHGLMLVGPTGSGKTSNYRILQKAMTALKAAGSTKYEKVKTLVCNPKSITMGQLYGQFDEITHEWTDGILASLFRAAVQDPTGSRMWVIFDGPVDALWIESMNTVLDENKKLCLVSGEIISMSSMMNIVFEVEDLSVASPATVSRCGMVYMEPTSCVGTNALVQSWLDSLNANIQAHVPQMKALFDAYMAPALLYVRRNLKEYVATVDNNLTRSCFRMLDSFFTRYCPDENGNPPVAEPEEIQALGQHIEALFLFSMIWSVGGNLDLDSRKKFDEFFRDQMVQHGVSSAARMPDRGSIYDYAYTISTSQWTHWMSTIPEYKLDPKLKFSDIIVPTTDSVRYNWLVEHLLSSRKHVMCVGPTGTGKTLNITDKLMRGMPDKFIPIFVSFSAQTSANQTQDILDAKFDKRRKGIYGPPAGKVNIIFVDDVNMPAREKYGAQPPIELLRQWMDHKGWYDRKALVFREIVDICFVGSMGPPGGGRNPVSNRFLRHFNFISFPEMEDDSMKRIFSTILSTFFNAYFPQAIQETCTTIVDSTVRIYNTVLAELLPTPAKSHYTFNLRDLAKVFQGVLSADPKRISDRKDIIRLWVHECARVFRDRLINNEDRGWFDTLVKTQVTNEFSASPADIYNVDRLIYGDYLVPGADPRIYEQVTDLKKLQKIVEEYLEDFNAATSKPMKLVMFLDAIEHVSRIARIIRQPGGNALLLGVGGSGRQSLTRLAAFMTEYKIFQIEIAKGYGMTEWRADIKKVLLVAGMEGKPIVFLFSDTQIVKEAFLEDLNNVLNSGEVPNIWDPADQESILAAMRPVCQAENLPVTKIALYARFLKRVRENIHMALCMSPVGDVFRSRLRMFPSLVNCCTIDWFAEWPEEALRSVASEGFEHVALGDKSIQQSVTDMCVYIHQSVERLSARFLAELRRSNYVTPTSYLELLTTFKKLLGEKRAELSTARKRLEVGLDKLISTEEQVKGLKVELTEMQPVLIQTGLQVEEMMVQIQKDKEAADVTRASVVKEEAEASVKAEECKAIKEDAERDLAEALPALDAAVAALKFLKVSDITEVSKYTSPPAGVKLVMEAVCVMKSVPPKKVGEAGKKVDDYWEPARKILSDPKTLLDDMFGFDKDHIPDSTIRKITPYIENPDFTPAKVESVSKACTAMCSWVRAMYKYSEVAKTVEPKRLRLNTAETELSATLSSLAEAKRRLKEVVDKIAQLEAQFGEAVAKKEELAKKVDECSVKLDRAERLIGGLGGEKIRWIETVAFLKEREVNIIGDVLVAAGSVAYLGAFTAQYRGVIVQEWIDKLKTLNVPCSPSASVRATLADPVQIRAWTIAGLPADAVSIENAIILSKARRWPLMIDPQGQANKWIKNMERESGLEVIKLSDKDFLRTLENAIRFGRPVLLENINEELDPSLEPILLKQTFKQGGSEMIKIGDNIVPYHPDFRFYITSKLRNPHYSPETSVKVTLLNFFITPDGLEDQMLGIVVAKERPDLEEMKNQLVVSNAKMKKELKEIEDTILRMLSESTGDILDDESLITTLSKSKRTSEDIKEKVAEAEKTEVEIDTTRNKYRPVAYRGAILFFCVADLALVDPMYQYSLNWFIYLFVQSIENSEKSDVLDIRLKNLSDFFTFALYRNVCRSLFETHKLLFSFVLCIKIMQGDDAVNPVSWRFLMAGGTTTVADNNPAPAWLTDKTWAEVCDLSKISGFEGFDKDLAANVSHYQAYFNSPQAHREPLTPAWDSKLGLLEKMCVLRCLRPDKIGEAIQDFVAHNIGQRYTEPPTFDLSSSYKDSSPTVPLIFVLSAGADPASELYKFADEMRFSKKMTSISLGQGQGPIAEKMIAEAVERGAWVLLQNCHLAISWMPALERIVENFSPEKMHRDFRLWLTSMPSDKFPVSVLQNGVKMTNEPPKGLRMNLMRSFLGFDETFLNSGKKPVEFKKLLFSLCFFHAVIQERRKFGSLGWNIRYEYTTGDLQVCIRQLGIFLNRYDDVPFKVLSFLTGQINYGGRVTDDWDRRTLMTILGNFICPEAIEVDYKFSPSGTYKTIAMQPDTDPQAQYLDYIRSLPVNPSPEIFGLHENAEISCARAETFELLNILLSLQPRTAAGIGKSRDEMISDAATSILRSVPDPILIHTVVEKYPTLYNECLNTVLQQEVIRYNKLLTVIKRSLGDILKALKGLVVMSSQLEAMGTSLFNNQVPEMWANVAYPSLKPLSSWVADLVARMNFIGSWFRDGAPNAFWISGFFFPQAFLTGTLQNYARKFQVSIDTVSFDFIFCKDSHKEVANKPEDGVYIYGLIFEGARWDTDTWVLGESRPKELYTDAPMIWLKPVQNRVAPPASSVFMCPVYKTLTRAGTLSTTGHSTNYVLTLEVPTSLPPSHWVNRGVALFSSLNF